MKKYILTAMLLLPITIFAGHPHPTKTDLFTDRIIRLTYNLEFSKALETVETELQNNPGSMQLKFFHAMILFRQSNYFKFQSDLGYDKNREKFPSLHDTAVSELNKIIESGNNILKSNPEDTTALFYAGAAYGEIGQDFARSGKFFKALSEGKKGLNYHVKLMKLCPDWDDIYLSEGIYNFFASSVPWFIKPLLWIMGRSGSESEAEKDLKVACGGRYSKYEALDYLALLYFRQKNVDAAVPIVHKLIEDFPNARFYHLVYFGFFLINNDMLEESEKLLNESVSAVDHETLNELNKYEIGDLYFYLAYKYKEKGKYDKVIRLWKEEIKGNYIPANESWGYLEMGNSYLEIGEKAEAKNCFEWILNNSKVEKHIKEAKEKLKDMGDG